MDSDLAATLSEILLKLKRLKGTVDDIETRLKQTERDVKRIKNKVGA